MVHCWAFRRGRAKVFPFWFLRKPRLFQTHVVLTELQQCPTWSASSFQNFSFDPERKSHSTVMYKNFVYPFPSSHKAGQMFGQHVCVCVYYNMWRAAPPCMDGGIAHCGVTRILQILLPDERTFLYFSLQSRIQEL